MKTTCTLLLAAGQLLLANQVQAFNVNCGINFNLESYFNTANWTKDDALDYGSGGQSTYLSKGAQPYSTHPFEYFNPGTSQGSFTHSGNIPPRKCYSQQITLTGNSQLTDGGMFDPDLHRSCDWGTWTIPAFPPEQCVPTCDPEEEDCSGENPISPILLDLDKNNFHLSNGPVSFDIDADGENDEISWVSPGELDGFLYYDRNGNGLVDDGSELFGNHTELASGEFATHGYEALMEFDSLLYGGNGDFKISDEDSMFSNLGVWIDENADGKFVPNEGLSLLDAGVVSISLELLELPRTDKYGNQFLYNSRIWINADNAVVPSWSTDVFLVNQ